VRVNCCLTRGLPGDVTERFFALGFSLEQMHRNLRDPERCVTGWAEQSEIPVSETTDEAAQGVNINSEWSVDVLVRIPDSSRTLTPHSTTSSARPGSESGTITLSGSAGFYAP
jgi:hypothetical protein